MALPAKTVRIVKLLRSGLAMSKPMALGGPVRDKLDLDKHVRVEEWLDVNERKSRACFCEDFAMGPANFLPARDIGHVDAWATFIGTPKGRNWFYDMYRRGEKDDAWYTMTLKASQSGILSEAERSALTADMSPALIAQEMECSFEESGTVQFIPTEIVEAARARRMDRATGARVMGVDVARFGDDRSVVLVRTDMLEDISVYRGLDLMQVAAQAAEKATIFKPDAIFVDGNGVGGGVVDRLRMLGYRVFDVQAGGRANAADRYKNKRAEMWGEMRTWLKDRGSIPESRHAHELADDLVSPQYSYDNAGRIVLEKKEKMKERGLPSPDIGDALALTFAEPVASQELRAVAWAEPVREYDPLEY